MENVVWNTTVKELNNIVKKCGYAVHSEKDATDENKKECMNLRMTLENRELSRFVGLDGFRMAVLKCRTKVSGQRDFLVNCKEFQAAIKQLKKDSNVCVTIRKSEMELETESAKITCKIAEPQIDIESLVPKKFMSVANTVVKDILPIGGKQRVGVNKILYLQPEHRFMEDGTEFMFDWRVEHTQKASEYEVGQTRARDRFSRKDHGRQADEVDMYTHICLNYKYFKQALRVLSPSTEVRMCFGDRPTRPMMIDALSDTEEYQALILPIIPMSYRGFDSTIQK